MDKHSLGDVGAEVVRHLRGSLSQSAASRWLGFESNVFYAWESQRRQPDALDVISLAEKRGSLRDGFQLFLRVGQTPDDFPPLQSAEGVSALLQDLKRDQSLVEIASRSGFSRFQLSRWLTGKANIGWFDLLYLVEVMTARALDFVAVFVDPGSLPACREEWRTLEASRSLFLKNPLAQTVLLALELESYRALSCHDAHFLARRLGLTVLQVTEAIDSLETTGQIRLEQGLYVHGTVRTVDTRRHPQAGTFLRKWWWEQGSSRILDSDASVSFNVFTCSENDLVAIKELYRSAYRQMRAIVAKSKPEERLVLLTHGVFPLDSIDIDEE